MKTRNMIAAVVVTTGLFVTGAVAQHEDHNKDQAPAGKTDTGKAGCMMSGNMMSGNMMSQTMMGQNETAKLVDRLMKNLAAIEAEKDPATLKKKLAEHGALLKELQTKVQAQSQRMGMMQNMMSESGEHKK